MSEPHQFQKPVEGKCQIFMDCPNKATTGVPYRLLGPVPACAQHRKWYDDLIAEEAKEGKKLSKKSMDILARDEYEEYGEEGMD